MDRDDDKVFTNLLGCIMFVAVSGAIISVAALIPLVVMLWRWAFGL